MPKLTNLPISIQTAWPARLFAHLTGWPLGLLHPLGWLLGWLTYGLSASYRQRFRLHTQQAGLSVLQHLAAVGHAGKMVAELPHVWGRPPNKPLGTRVIWHGDEDTQNAIDEGKGIVLMTPHIGCFEMVAQAYAERFGSRQPIHVLYRPAKLNWLGTIMQQARQRPGMTASPATLMGVRKLLRALKQGHTIGLLPDQVPPQGMGVWTTFFGQAAYTMTMAAKLIAQTDAAVMLFRCERLGFWQRLLLRADFTVHATRVPTHIETQLKTQNIEESTDLINRLMQNLIMQNPEQYLWAYNRYKQPRLDIHVSTSPIADS